LKLNVAVRFVVLSFTIYVSVQVNLHVSKRSLTKITNPCVIVNCHLAAVALGIIQANAAAPQSELGDLTIQGDAARFYLMIASIATA